MTTLTSHPDLDQQNTVASLGLRWAALRGMLDSPLINAEDQRALRDELVRELRAIERAVGGLAARNEFEVSAKLEIIRQTISDAAGKEAAWAVDLLDSIGQDVKLLVQRVRLDRAASPSSSGRPASGSASQGPSA